MKRLRAEYIIAKSGACPDRAKSHMNWGALPSCYLPLHGYSLDRVIESLIRGDEIVPGLYLEAGVERLDPRKDEDVALANLLA